MNSEIFIFNLLAEKKEDAVKEMLDALEIGNKEEAFRAVMEREELSSTLVTDIIAIPHARTSAVNKLTYAVARSIDGVEWNGGRAKIIILTLSPMTATGEHVVFLSHVAQLLSSQKNIDMILNAETPEEMEEVFIDYAS